MKKFFLIILTLLSISAYSQTISVTNNTLLTIAADFLNCNTEIVANDPLIPGASTQTSNLGDIAKVNISTGLVNFSLYSQNPTLSCYYPGRRQSIFIGGNFFVWTDLGNGDVQLTIW